MDRYILSARYGLDGRQRATLREVAVHVGIWPEGVRQRQKRAEIGLRGKLEDYGPEGSGKYGRAS